MGSSDGDTEIATLKAHEAEIRKLMSECRPIRQRLKEALLQQATLLSKGTVLREIKSQYYWVNGWLLRANAGHSLFLEKTSQAIWSAAVDGNNVQLIREFDLQLTVDLEGALQTLKQCAIYAANTPVNSIQPESLEDAIVRCANELAAKRALNADDLLAGAPSGNVLALIEPKPANDHNETTNGFAMVYHGRSRVSQNEPHFWIMTLKMNKPLYSSYEYIEAFRICRLRYDNPEHLALIRDVLGV